MTTTRPHTNRDDVSELDRLRALGGACAEYADCRAESFRSLMQIRADAAIHALIAALEQALAASEREKKVAVMFGDAFEDAAKGCHWMLEYERGLRHVIVANWMYASRADEAYAAGYDAAMQQVEFKDEALDGMHAQLREADALIAALEAEVERANELCIRDLEHTEKRAEQAEADLAAAREEARHMQGDALVIREVAERITKEGTDAPLDPLWLYERMCEVIEVIDSGYLLARYQPEEDV